MDIEGYRSAIGLVNGLLGTVHGVFEIKSSAAFNKKAAEIYSQLHILNERLLKLQTEHSALVRQRDDLERKVTEMERWSKNEQLDYELFALPAGTLVYRLKVLGESEDPVYYLCPSCYQKQVKSILQPSEPVNHIDTLKCYTCSVTFLHQAHKQDYGFMSTGRNTDLDGFF
ncbi:TPA: hypothetical protein QHC21_005711 [Raoultella planticola]|nr:hypothetical protein [Raoultella planticola]HDT6041499.1 hypothetical protein [Raoultella planticola]HDT6045127.1 hypothetical protein [Raoultella planticola]